MSKFDLDLNPLASYHVSHNECECPRGAKPTCRHRKMLKVFLSGGHVDDGWFLDYESRLWTAPLKELTGLQEEQILIGFHQPELLHLQPGAPPPDPNGSGATTPAPAPAEVSPSPRAGAGLRIRRIPGLMG